MKPLWRAAPSKKNRSQLAPAQRAASQTLQKIAKTNASALSARNESQLTLFTHSPTVLNDSDNCAIFNDTQGDFPNLCQNLAAPLKQCESATLYCAHYPTDYMIPFAISTQLFGANSQIQGCFLETIAARGLESLGHTIERNMGTESLVPARRFEQCSTVDYPNNPSITAMFCVAISAPLSLNFTQIMTDTTSTLALPTLESAMDCGEATAEKSALVHFIIFFTCITLTLCGCVCVRSKMLGPKPARAEPLLAEETPTNRRLRPLRSGRV